MTRTPTLALAALLGASLSASTGARQAKAQGTKTPDPATVRSLISTMDNEPDLAVLKAMKNQVFPIKYCDAGRLRAVLKPLCSGVPGAMLSAQSSSDLNAISVRDFPSNLAAIQAAIARLDVPTAAMSAPSIELHIQVLFASKAPAPQASVPPDLQKVLTALKGTLAYRSFTPIANFVQRAKAQIHAKSRIEGYGLVDRNALGGEAPKQASELKVDWSAFGIGVEEPKDGPARISLEDFRLEVHEFSQTGSQKLADFDTGLDLMEGESVVVGTSVVKDRGLIVVISARRVK